MSAQRGIAVSNCFKRREKQRNVGGRRNHEVRRRRTRRKGEAVELGGATPA